MTFRGIYKDGIVILGSVDIPNGAEVDVNTRGGAGKSSRARGKAKAKRAASSSKSKRKSEPTLNERLASVIGKAKGLPRDASRNIDHYLYGAAKR